MKSLLMPLLGKLLSSFISRILTALGLTFVTYTGFNYLLGQLKGSISNLVGQMPSDIFNLLMISGIGSGLGYLFGAFTFKLSMSMMTKLITKPST